MKKLLYVLLILALTVNPAFGADKFMEGTGADVISGGDSVSDVDTLLASSLTNPLNRLSDKYLSGCELVYTDANTVTVSVGRVVCQSAAGIHRFRENTATTAVDLSAAVGVGGLDAGAEAANTTYYIYACADADATTFTAIGSLSNTNPAVGECVYYLLLGAVRNDASSDILKFYQVGDWLYYDIQHSVYSGAGLAAYTDVDLSTYVPNFGEMTVLLNASGAHVSYLRRNGGAGTFGIFADATTAVGAYQAIINTDSSQVIEHKEADTDAHSIYVLGYDVSVIRGGDV